MSGPGKGMLQRSSQAIHITLEVYLGQGRIKGCFGVGTSERQTEAERKRGRENESCDIQRDILE